MSFSDSKDRKVIQAIIKECEAGSILIDTLLHTVDSNTAFQLQHFINNYHQKKKDVLSTISEVKNE